MVGGGGGLSAIAELLVIISDHEFMVSVEHDKKNVSLAMKDPYVICLFQ